MRLQAAPLCILLLPSRDDLSAQGLEYLVVAAVQRRAAKIVHRNSVSRLLQTVLQKLTVLVSLGFKLDLTTLHILELLVGLMTVQRAACLLALVLLPVGPLLLA